MRNRCERSIVVHNYIASDFVLFFIQFCLILFRNLFRLRFAQLRNGFLGSIILIIVMRAVWIFFSFAPHFGWKKGDSFEFVQ